MLLREEGGVRSRLGERIVTKFREDDIFNFVNVGITIEMCRGCSGILPSKSALKEQRFGVLS